MDWPTIIIASLVAVVVFLILFFGIRNKKKGKSSCSCGSCGGCGLRDSCHTKK